MKKKVIKHLKGDIKNYKHEMQDDKNLIKSLKKTKEKSGKKNEKC
jgi:hypothetical protein